MNRPRWAAAAALILAYWISANAGFPYPEPGPLGGSLLHPAFGKWELARLVALTAGLGFALATAAGPQNWAPVWAPDGRRLVFLVSGERPDAIYWRSADGNGEAEHLVQGRSAEGWTGGGSHMRFLTLTGDRDYGISLLDMRTRTAAPLIDLPRSAQHSSSVSPDERWIAYASNETGQYEVWIEPLPRTGARHQLTRGGGSHPLWTPDGRSLYFDRGQRLFRLTVDLAAPSAGGELVPLPIAGFVQGEYRRQYDLLPDGRRFVMLFRAP